jgi:hypothetical protein
MDLRVAAIVVGLLAAGLPALAQQSNFTKPVAPAAAPKTASKTAPNTAPKPAHLKAHQAAAKKPAVEKAHIAARSETAAPADDQTGTVTRRRIRPAAKGVHASAIPAAYAAIPEAERLAIQSDLAWLGDYDATAAGDFESRTVDAIKAFQKRHGGKETGVLNEEQRAALAAAVKAPQEAVGWRLIDDPATGTRIGLPEKLVPQSAASRTGSRWLSGHGQIQIETFRLREAALPALFDEEKKTPRQRRVESSVLKPDSFIISGMQGLKKFLRRGERRRSARHHHPLRSGHRGHHGRRRRRDGKRIPGIPRPECRPAAGTKAWRRVRHRDRGG